jgi:hypothetical protein
MSARDSFKFEKLKAHFQANIQNETNFNSAEIEANQIQHLTAVKSRFVKRGSYR